MMKRSKTALAALIILSLARTGLAQESDAIFDAALVFADSRQRVERTLDLNGDGFEDAVGWWWQSSSKQWITITGFINQGDGSLQEAWTESWLSNWTSPLTHVTAAGDLDGNSFEDFVIGIGTDVVPYSSNGAAKATEHPAFSLPDKQQVHSLHLADFDGDSDDDLVVGSENTVYIYTNDGSGSAWTLASQVGIGVPALELVVGDADGSGGPDVVLGVPNAVRLFPVTGGVITTGPELQHGLGSTPQVTCGDVTGNGMQDIVLFEPSGTYQLLRRTGPVDWTLEAAAVGGPATDLADVNGDGVLDGVCCGGGSTYPLHNELLSNFEIAINDGSGNFAPSFRIESLGAEHIAGVADLDHDGDVDLVAGRTVYYGRGPMTGPLVEDLGGGEQESRGVIDIDLDGDSDLEVGILVGLRNQGDGTFMSQSPGFVPAGPGSRYYGPGFPGDFDGDGDDDLIVQEKQGSVLLNMRLLKNDGSGFFVDGGPAGPAGVDFNIGQQFINEPKTSLAADIDGDGDLDLVTNQLEGSTQPLQYTMSSKMWVNDGAGFFQPGPEYPNRIIKAVADFDGNGVPDLVTINSNTYRLVYHMGLGGLTWSGPVVFQNALVMYPETPVGIEDLDMDGDPDVAAAAAGNWMGVYLSNGDGTFATTYPITIGSLQGDPKHLALTDVDADGAIDIVVGPVDYANNSSFVIRKKLGQSGWHAPITQVFKANVSTDVDRDGDRDMIHVGVVFNRTREPSEGMTYCTSKLNSCGTLPSIAASGTPSASASNGFTINASNTKAGKAGLLIYTDAGPMLPAAPFQGGFLCIGPTPLKRTIAVVDTTGTPGQCDGMLSIDMNAFAAGALGGNPLASLALPSTRVEAQFWGRDSSSKSLLSDALTYLIAP